MSELTENWRAVRGFEGRYDVSNLGQVNSLPRPRTRGGILRLRVSPGGYDRVSLYHIELGKQVDHYVHDLVAEAFIGPKLPGTEVKHGPAWQVGELGDQSQLRQPYRELRGPGAGRGSSPQAYQGRCCGDPP